MKKAKAMINSHIRAVFFIVMVSTVLLSGFAEAQASRFNMTYSYFGGPGDVVGYVDRTKGALQTVSPSYFDIDAEGNLTITGKFDPDFVREMHSRGIEVVPFLSNHWDRPSGRAALENRERLAEQLADAVEEYDLDGVHVDIENLTADDRDNYVDFVRILRETLPEGKEISAAVAANPKGITYGWQGSYDYEGLAEYCDYLMIMAYDEAAEGSAPGPVASITFVEDAIKYALDRVPAGKIVLGIPFYGRYWKSGEQYGGYGIHMTMVGELIERYNGKVVFDEYSASPKAVITVRKGQETVISGRRLDPGTYTIWFENEQSIKYKLRLVQKYGLKGTGSWSLGQETADIWSFYSSWLNGNWFVDTEDHWARKAIAEMEDRGWMKGISSTLFAPDNSLTRAQAAVILVRALELEATGKSGGHYSDVRGMHWAEQEIDIISQHDIMKGVGSGKFAPDKPVTREQMAVMLDRIFGGREEEEAECPFRDITSGHWAYRSIVAMNARGIFEGYEDGTFRPGEYITRAQMAVLMSRVAEYIE